MTHIGKTYPRDERVMTHIGKTYPRDDSKTKVLNSPLYRGLKLWDSLPADIQKEKDARTFKKRLSTHTFQ